MRLDQLPLRSKPARSGALIQASLPPTRTFFPFSSRIFRSVCKPTFDFCRACGLEPPYRWIAEFVGVKGRRLQVPPPQGHMNIFPGPVCLADLISADGTIGRDEQPVRALRPFFEMIFGKCGMARPDHRRGNFLAQRGDPLMARAGQKQRRRFHLSELTARAEVIMEQSMPTEPTSHARRPRIVAIVTDGGGHLSVAVWYQSETGQRTLVAKELVDNLTAAETIVNAHATRAGVPLQDVELIHR